MTPEEVLVLYGRAWFERDRDQRIEALRSACTEDILFMDPQLGRLHGLEAVADMIGSYMNAPMEGHEAEEREEHARGMSGSGVSVEVVTPIESFHQFYRYSYVWHFPDGRSSGGTSFCEQARRTDPSHHGLAGIGSLPHTAVCARLTSRGVGPQRTARCATPNRRSGPGRSGFRSVPVVDEVSR